MRSDCSCSAAPSSSPRTRNRCGSSSSRSALRRLGIALVGNVPNSILLGRWFGPRLPTAMAVVYSAMGGRRPAAAAGLAAPDRPYRLARGLSVVRHHRAVPCGAADAAAVAAVRDRLAARRAEGAGRGRRRRLDAWQRHAPSRLLGAVLDLLLHRGRHVRHFRADRCLSDRCRLPSAAGSDRLGLFRRRADLRHGQRVHARRHHRPPAVGAAQLRHLDSRDLLPVADAVVSELLAADRVRHLLRQHDRFARPVDHGDRAEILSAASGSARSLARSRSAAGSARPSAHGAAA